MKKVNNLSENPDRNYTSAVRSAVIAVTKALKASRAAFPPRGAHPEWNEWKYKQGVATLFLE